MRIDVKAAVVHASDDGGDIVNDSVLEVLTAPLQRAPLAVIFDCDGTLVDSERLGAEVMAECLAELGHRLDVDDAVARYRGYRLAQSLERLQQHMGIRLPTDFMTTLRIRAALWFSTRLKEVPGALATVAALHLPRAVASNGPPDQLRQSLQITGLLPHFGVHVYSAYTVKSWKPEPGLFLHAARALGFAPADCLVIEDSAPGVAAARAAGMPVLAFCPHDEPIEGADGVPVLKALADLLPLLRGLEQTGPR